MAFRRLLLICITATLSCLVAASSRARNPLQYIAKLQSPVINKPDHKIDSFSNFDLEFQLYQPPTTLRLVLEPNYDVIPSNAVVTILDQNGRAIRSEPIDPSDHRVYRGSAYIEAEHGSWAEVGWARITVYRDGQNPLFEGAFSVNNDNHHILLPSTYLRSKHSLDPNLDETNDDHMLVYRDSDVSKSPLAPNLHTELKREEPFQLCSSDVLEFNSRPDHPIFQNISRRTDSPWAVTPVWDAFGKRQVDSVPNGGNSGGVVLSKTIGDSEGCPSTKKVALVGVATDCGYTKLFDDDQALRQYVIKVMNLASGVWESTFNISLGLQNLTISPRECPGSPQLATPWNQECSSSLTMQSRLNLFSKWRGDLGDLNSHWTLLTRCQQDGEVGLAWLGQACVQTAQESDIAGGGTETVSGANVVAHTSNEWQVIAHETGHTFGAVHDCDSDTCQRQHYVNAQQCCPFTGSVCSANSQFIMNPYTLSGQNAFSQCTLGNICSAIGRNSVDTSCLSDNTGVRTITGHQCGNGIVEEGEDCDCGGPEGCVGDPCCNPTTCKFTSGSVCDDANEDCCVSCSFAPAGSVCRPSTGPCDPEEKCSGTKATCPRDILAPDGRGCYLKGISSNDGDLTCASGQCTSRSLQCQTVMGQFTHGKNNTYACDENTCLLSCGSPDFPPNVCYKLSQNMLDGTPCGGGGSCRNGQCQGSDLGKEIVSWISDHKSIVIGVAVALGVLLLFIVGSCICGCIRRRKRQKQPMKLDPRQNSSWYGPPPTAGMQAPRQWPGGMAPAPGQQQPNQAWGHNAHSGWRPPQSPFQSPPQSPVYSPGPTSLYGGGIIGSRGPAAQTQPPPPYMAPPPFSQYSGYNQNTARYA